MLAQRQMASSKEFFQFVAQRNLVAQTQLDVDALNAIGVLGHARQRNHHVLVDLESVGVLADRRRAFSVQPEFLARIGTDGDEAFAAARIGNAHHLRGGAGHGIGIIAGNITHQHHFGQAATARLGGVTHGPQVAVIQMLQAGQQNARALLLAEHEVLDLDDAGHRVPGVAKELQAHGARVRRLAVHDPARAGNQTVATLFLDTGQAAQELVGHVLAQAPLAESGAGNVELLGTQQRLAVSGEILQLKARQFDVVDLAEVVPQTRHFQPLGLRRHHAPARQIVQRGAPQNGFLAAGVHGNVAANAGGLGRRRVHGKNKTGALGRIRHALRHDTGLGPDRGHRLRQPRQGHQLDLGHGFELFGIDDHALPGQGNGTAGVAGTPATRNDGQPEFNAALHQRRHLGFGVRRQHNKRVLDTPVGRIGHMADARQAVKLDVVLGGQAVKHPLRPAAQCRRFNKCGVKSLHRCTSRSQQFADQGVALRIPIRHAALLHFAQAVLQRFHQQLAALRVVQ